MHFVLQVAPGVCLDILLFCLVVCGGYCLLLLVLGCVSFRSFAFRSSSVCVLLQVDFQSVLLLLFCGWGGRSPTGKTNRHRMSLEGTQKVALTAHGDRKGCCQI